MMLWRNSEENEQFRVKIAELQNELKRKQTDWITNNQNFHENMEKQRRTIAELQKEARKLENEKIERTGQRAKIRPGTPSYNIIWHLNISKFNGS